jgi:hypothetical protein
VVLRAAHVRSALPGAWRPAPVSTRRSGPGRPQRSGRLALGLAAATLLGGAGLGAALSPAALASPLQASSAGCQSTLPAGAQVVATATTPTGGGYWETDQFGDIAAFGDAHCQGSLSGVHLNQPIVAMAATPSGDGYWLVAADGGVFSFGNARFFGSAAADHLVQPIVGVAATPSGDGYWLVAADGGVFTFGNARFFGSAAADSADQPIVGMDATATAGGYWLEGASGQMVTFGDAKFLGQATVAASSPRCTSADLAASLGSVDNAAGHAGQRVILTNTSAATCTLYGYPGMLMLGSSGQALATRVIRSAAASPSTVTLPHGGTASFLASWPDATGYGYETCPTSNSVEITPPNAMRPLVIHWHITPYGGTLMDLRCGQVTLSPVEKG